MSSEISNAGYRNALILYAMIAFCVWYFTHGLGIFVAQNFLPQTASGFSIANPRFGTWNNMIAIAVSAVGTVGLFANEKLKEYISEVGEEVSRISWASIEESRNSTGIVLALVFVSSIFLFLIDFVFTKAMHFFISTAT